MPIAILQERAPSAIRVQQPCPYREPSVDTSLDDDAIWNDDDMCTDEAASCDRGLRPAKSILLEDNFTDSFRQAWTSHRKKTADILESRSFDLLMGVIILFNLGLMVSEANHGALCENGKVCHPVWITATNYILMAIYTVELVARFAVYRCNFFHDRWNTVDFVIVQLGYLEILISQFGAELLEEVDGAGGGLQLVRILRLGRLARLVRLLKAFPSLYSMTRGFAATLSTIMWGFGVIMMLLLLWSLVLVEFIHPQNRDYYALHGGDTQEWCYVAFSSVGFSMVYFFQTLVAGDSWGACSIPLMRDSWPAFVVFSLAYITVQLGFTNLVLAVIVDAAAKAREGDTAEKLQEKKRQEKAATDKLRAITKRMDTDGNGTISWQELKTSFHTDREVRDLLNLLDIDESDLHRMFNLMDADHSGSLDYEEFVEAISKAEEQDVRVQLMILKLHMSDIAWKLDQMFKDGTESSSPARTPAKIASCKSQNVQKEKSNAKKCHEGGGLVQSDGPCTNVSEVAAALDHELSSLHTDLLEKLEALSQEASQQVSTLTVRTRCLTAALSQPGSSFFPDPGRSTWSKDVVKPLLFSPSGPPQGKDHSTLLPERPRFKATKVSQSPFSGVTAGQGLSSDTEEASYLHAVPPDANNFHVV